MILETVFNILLELVKFFVEILDFSPAVALPDWGAHFLSLLLKGLSFFPFDVWSIVISNVMFWVGVHFVWAVIEWIYIKIPGVD